MSAHEEAIERALVGWARNLPSGDVEGEVQGAASAVDAFLAWCAQGPPGARVERVEHEERAVADDLRAFSIRR